MSEQAYTLLSWNGQVHGSFSATEIKRLWETEEISGLYQVVTDQGNLSVQEFVALVEDATEKNRHYQEQLALAEAEEQRVLQAQMREGGAQAAERIEPEGSHKPKSKNGVSVSDKIYYIFLDEEKKGPFSKQNLQVMYRAGRVDDDTQVWTEDLGEWVELKGFEEIVGRKQSTSSGFSPNIPIHSNRAQHPIPIPAKPEAPDGLIFTLWSLVIASFFVPMIFGNVLTVDGFFMVQVFFSLAFIVIAITLCCSPSTKGRANGIVGVILFTIGLALFSNL
ncbi:MAG: DUF4339 domain-containing protein [Opitutales bacterium]|nr:DUF4339 domain-containing protein [Opitutales bacterium]